MSKVMEVASKRLEPPDRVQKSYRIGYDRSEGFIVLTNRKAMVLEERGFFRPSYHVIVEIPYPEIAEVTVEDTHRLVITDTEDRKHAFVTFAEVTATILERDLTNLIRSITP